MCLKHEPFTKEYLFIQFFWQISIYLVLFLLVFIIEPSYTATCAKTRSEQSKAPHNLYVKSKQRLILTVTGSEKGKTELLVSIWSTWDLI